MFDDLQKKDIDHDLILAFAYGDRKAAQQLTERLMPKMYAHAYFRLGNIADAEDVTQEAFFTIMAISSKMETREGASFHLALSCSE